MQLSSCLPALLVMTAHDPVLMVILVAGASTTAGDSSAGTNLHSPAVSGLLPG